MSIDNRYRIDLIQSVERIDFDSSKLRIEKVRRKRERAEDSPCSSV